VGATRSLRNSIIAERYIAGENMEEIGKSYGISRQRVHSILIAAGVERRSRGGPRPSKLDYERVVREYNRVLSVYEVSKVVGCSQSAVYQILQRSGTPLIRRSKFNDLPMEAIKQRYLSGERLDAIAASVNVKPNYLNNLLRKYGVPRRSNRGRKSRVASGETAVDNWSQV
jgi:Mor family transcriptional regulator